MKFSFATLGCPTWSIDMIAERAAAMGYHGVELRTSADANHLRPDESAENRRVIRRTFERAGVEIACLMGYTNFATPSDQEQSKSLAVCRSLMQTAAQVGCATVRIFGGDFKDGDRSAAVDRVVASLESLLPLAAECNVRLAFETHDAWCDPSTLMDVMLRLPSPNLGICWDIANTASRIPHAQAWTQTGPRIIHVHAKDTVADSHNAALPGSGSARLAEALRLLRDGGYGRWVSFEWEKKWQTSIPEPDVAFPLYLEFVREVTGLRLYPKMAVPETVG